MRTLNSMKITDTSLHKFSFYSLNAHTNIRCGKPSYRLNFYGAVAHKCIYLYIYPHILYQERYEINRQKWKKKNGTHIFTVNTIQECFRDRRMVTHSRTEPCVYEYVEPHSLHWCCVFVCDLTIAIAGNSDNSNGGSSKDDRMCMLGSKKFPFVRHGEYTTLSVVIVVESGV